MVGFYRPPFPRVLGCSGLLGSEADSTAARLPNTLGSLLRAAQRSGAISERSFLGARSIAAVLDGRGRRGAVSPAR